MESEEEGLLQNKKLLGGLGFVVLFAIYMLWPSSAAPAPVTTDLDSELAELQALRSGGGGNGGGFINSSFDGTDNRGIELGVGGSSNNADGSLYETTDPDIAGVLVGYGTQTDSRGEYLVAYVQNPNEQGGYEVDLRDVQRYDLRPPSIWEIDSNVSVFGAPEDGNRFRARSIR